MTRTLLCLLLLVVATLQQDVSRNVQDYGAKGDGITDDTQAIITALTQGRGDTSAPYPDTTYSSSTQHPCYVYFPPGVYLVTKPLPLIYYTQMVGEPSDLPTILYKNTQARLIEVAGNWYTGVNQNNFYRGLRNFILDLTQCDSCTAVHWQVAQATSITNVLFKLGVGSQNQGIWMENGSGGFVSDLVFEGGIYGMWIGNQQFTSRNITIDQASISAIYLNWDWLWTFVDLSISNTPVAIDVGSGVGSVAVVDSQFTNCAIGIRTTFNTGSGVNSVVIDNLQFETQESTGIVVEDANGNVVLKAPSGSSNVKLWVQGHVWGPNSQNTIETVDLSNIAPNRSSTLAPNNGLFFGMTRPLYIGEPTVDVTTVGVVGDGVTDITAPLQAALTKYAGNTVLFFPHGTYIISSTVVVPPNTRMYGQVWSVLMASGQAFQDVNNPIPMLQVGAPGQQGIAQMSDFLITTKGPQPGAVLVQWNMHDPEGKPGSCGMWDVQYRIGGAIGTNMDPSNCPSGDGSNAPASVCTGAWALLHITSSGNVYLENVWGWTADHDIDYQNNVNIYNWRGLLCESQGPVWMYGTAMEHSVLYQYNFYGASNVFMGHIQTEIPYYQPSQQTPFSHGAALSDPAFCEGDARCNMAYALTIHNSNNLHIYSTGLYSFFNTWNQSCLQSTPPSCSLNLVNITDSTSVYMHAFNTYGSEYMYTTDQPYSAASENTNTFCAAAVVDLNLF